MPPTSNQLHEIHETLARIGLSKTEQEAYLTLLKLGISTANPVAKSLSIPLTTTQSLLKRLVKTGIVQETKNKSRSVYEAKDPLIFKTLLEERLRDISTIIPLLKTIPSGNGNAARIHIYDRERVTEIFSQALESKNKFIYEIVSAKDLQEHLGERFHFTKRRIEKSIRLKSLRVEAGEIKKYNKSIHERELREARFLPRELSFQTSILFWENTATFFSSSSEGLVFVVQSKSFVVMLKQLFELLWSVSRKMETLQE